jgi:hypothetical protein
MLEFVVRAAIGTLGLAFAVQFGLWALRLRQPKMLLSAWTAVLIASVATPAISPVVQLSPSGATAVHALGAHEAVVRGDWLTGIYLCVAAFLLLRLLRGLALSWRMLRATQPVAADWASGKKLRTSTWIGAPVTIGRHVLLPAECVNWDARKRRAVLAHHAAHAARGDFYVQLLSEVNRAVFWFSPLSWWLHGRLTALAELASDDAAIEAPDDRPRIMTEEHPHLNLSRDRQSKEVSHEHEENGCYLVARNIRHRSVVRLHARVGYQNEWQVLPVV